MRKIIGLYIVLLTLVILPTIEYAFAAGDEPGEYVDRRVEIWNLIFRMMTVAFVVGAVVSGTMIWLCWRFRESHPKATPTAYEKAGDWGGSA
jgi:heme/copper-type cytochrome/quinol oxidase subunit 2